MKTSQKWHGTVCFETCIVVTRNIQWEVTLAWSTLRASCMVRINPKTQSFSRDYRQEQRQRQTNRPKRFCPWNHLHLLWSSLLCRLFFCFFVFFSQLYIKKNVSNGISAYHEIWVYLSWYGALLNIKIPTNEGNNVPDSTAYAQCL